MPDAYKRTITSSLDNEKVTLIYSKCKVGVKYEMEVEVWYHIPIYGKLFKIGQAKSQFSFSGFYKYFKSYFFYY